MLTSLDTGLHSPSAEGLVYSDFTNPTNVYTSNNVYCSVSVAYPAEKNQDWYNFNFGTIPSTATIKGIEVTCEYYNLYTPTQRIYLYSTSAGAESTYKSIAYDVTEAVKTYGSATDLWGTTWIPSDFDNGSFYYRIYAASLVSGTKYLYIDWIQVRVHYKIFQPTVMVFN
jgi:hypothetical protein